MATIKIDELKVETAVNDQAEVVKGGRSNQEVYLTYKLENVMISSY